MNAAHERARSFTTRHVAAGLLVLAAIAAACSPGNHHASPTPATVTKNGPLRPSIVPPPSVPVPAPISEADAKSLIEAYYKARVERTGPADFTDTLRYEGGAAAMVRYGVIDRVTKYGATRTHELATVYESAAARGVDVYLPPPGPGPRWFQAAVREVPSVSSTDDVYRTTYLWALQQPSGEWRIMWWLSGNETKEERDAIPPRIGPGRTWSAPTNPTALATDPATVCEQLTGTADPKIKDWSRGVAWGPNVHAFRDKIETLWGPTWVGRYLQGGDFDSSSTLWPGPTEPAWEAADGSVLVPCTYVLAYSIRPAPGQTVSLWGDTGFEQSVGNPSKWARWDQTMIDRALVRIPTKASGSKIDFVKISSWPLWAEGTKP